MTIIAELSVAIIGGVLGGIGCHYLTKNEKPVGPNWPLPPDSYDPIGDAEKHYQELRSKAIKSYEWLKENL